MNLVDPQASGHRPSAVPHPKRTSTVRLGIVVPRYGETVLGGAETFARQFAEHLPRDEFSVTVLTSCARDLVTWRNEFPPGRSQVGGLPVLRFPMSYPRRSARLHRQLNDRFNRGESAAPREQVAWLEHSAHSPDLYRHLARHGSDFDLLLFLPYLFGITLYGSAIWPGKSVLWPCLHDEAFAGFADVRLMMQSVRGLMFVSAPEQTLAEEALGVRHPAARLVGFGLDGFTGEAERFRTKFGLSEPFVLYSGRLDPTKNVLQLISHFLAYRQRHQDRLLKLVLAGSGPLAYPKHPDVVAVGSLAPNDLHDAYAAATVLCQPSLRESFSIVLMESWLAGTPVLVHGHCPVTRYHALHSNGGLYYTSFAEFAAALDWLLDHPQGRERMGALGQAYVRQQFNWPSVLDRTRAAVATWTS